MLSIVAMTVVLGITLYHRMSLVKSVSLLTAAMLALTIAGSVGFIGWAIYVLAVAVFAVSGIRQSLISRKALVMFKKVLPAMSQTEKEALDAGTVWWEAELFKGKPEWQKLHAIKAPKLSKEEQAFLDGPVNEVCAMVSDFPSNTRIGRFTTRSMAIPERQQILRHDHQEEIRWPRILSVRAIFGTAKTDWCFWRTVVNRWCT